MKKKKRATPHSYLLIGSGRTAKHLGHYFEQLNLPFQTWKRGQKDLAKKLKAATHVLVLISDSQLESFFDENLKNSKSVLIHCSGALEIPGMISAHPLMSFADDLYDSTDYMMMPFILTSTAKPFAEILPGLSNPHFVIKAKDKAIYHALCVLGGNLSTYLWQTTLAGFESLGLPKQVAHPYMLRLCQNLLLNPKAALTGPLARKDLKTVLKNDQALKKVGSQNIYRSFVKAIYPEALTKMEKS